MAKSLAPLTDLVESTTDTPEMDEYERKVWVLAKEAEIYADLSTPFTDLHQRQLGGQTFDYITGEQATTAANTKLGFLNWDYEVVEHGINKEANEVWVLVRVTVCSPVSGTWRSSSKDAFGSAKIKTRQSGEIMNLGNDFKSATTSAKKVALAQFGIGLHLYEKDLSDIPDTTENFKDPHRTGRAPQFNAPVGTVSGDTVTGMIGRVAASGKGLVLDNVPGFQGQWMNTGGQNPINLGAFYQGQVVTITYKRSDDGKAIWINAIAPAEVAAAAATGDEEPPF